MRCVQEMNEVPFAKYRQESATSAHTHAAVFKNTTNLSVSFKQAASACVTDSLFI